MRVAADVPFAVTWPFRGERPGDNRQGCGLSSAVERVSWSDRFLTSGATLHRRSRQVLCVARVSVRSHHKEKGGDLWRPRGPRHRSRGVGVSNPGVRDGPLPNPWVEGVAHTPALSMSVKAPAVSPVVRDLRAQNRATFVANLAPFHGHHARHSARSIGAVQGAAPSRPARLAHASVRSIVVVTRREALTAPFERVELAGT
jgi:hypothetical protein